jgi:hypothetical protein
MVTEYEGQKAETSYRTASTCSATYTAATTTATTSTSSRPLAALVAASAFTATCGTLGLGLSRLWLTGKLNRDLALKNLLSREFCNSGSGLGCGSKIDESIANGAVVARVHRDGNALTRTTVSYCENKNLINN